MVIPSASRTLRNDVRGNVRSGDSSVAKFALRVANRLPQNGNSYV